MVYFNHLSTVSGPEQGQGGEQRERDERGQGGKQGECDEPGQGGKQGERDEPGQGGKQGERDDRSPERDDDDDRIMREFWDDQERRDIPASY